MGEIGAYKISLALHNCKNPAGKAMIIIKVYNSKFPFRNFFFPYINIPSSWHAGQNVACMLWVCNSFPQINPFGDRTPSQYCFSIVGTSQLYIL